MEKTTRKAKKFFYYKTHMIKDFNKFRLDHNKFDAGVRGKWRKFNPYNPNQGTEEEQKELKIESLDDLFDDDIDKPKDTTPKENTNSGNEVALGNIFDEEIAPSKNDNDLNSIALDDYVDKPSESSDDILDIQKELEAKFDELFGDSED